MSERASNQSRKDEAEDVSLILIVVPFAIAAIFGLAVVLYRCRAHQIRQRRLAQEREQELFDMKGALVV